MVITETWLTTEVSPKLKGAHVIQMPPDPHQGILVLINRSFSHVHPIAAASWTPNTVVIRARHSSLTTPIYIIGLYARPEAQKQIYEELAHYVELLRSRFGDCQIAVLGDFNCSVS